MGSSGINIQVHPMMLFLLSLPLFTVQLCMLMLLLLDMDPSKQLSGTGNFAGPGQWHVSDNVLLSMQILQTCAVQVMLFRELMSGLHTFVFILNPASWTDIDRPGIKPSHWTFKIFYHALFIWP